MSALRRVLACILAALVLIVRAGDATCAASSVNVSPVAIETSGVAEDATLPRLSFAYTGEFSFALATTTSAKHAFIPVGRTTLSVRLEPPGGGEAPIGRGAASRAADGSPVEYMLDSVQVYTPSPHPVNDIVDRAAVHLVHLPKDDASTPAVVVAVRLADGGSLLPSSDALETMVDVATTQREAVLRLPTLMPADTDNYFHYVGNATTFGRGCMDDVAYFILQDPLLVTSNLLASLPSLTMPVPALRELGNRIVSARPAPSDPAGKAHNAAKLDLGVIIVLFLLSAGAILLATLFVLSRIRAQQASARKRKEMWSVQDVDDDEQGDGDVLM